MNLYAEILRPYVHERNKHEKHDDYAEDAVNAMSNIELLRAISDVLGDLPEPGVAWRQPPTNSNESGK